MTHVLPSPQENSGAFALGTYALTGAYGAVDPAVARSTVDHFIDLGGCILDTADLYGNGASETLTGQAARNRRGQLVLCTKFGFLFGQSMDERGIDARPSRVEAACDASLRRLGTDVIDLYYLHRVDPAVPIEDTVGAMGALVTKGKVRAIGLCEVGELTLRRALAVHPVAAVQSEYSLWAREPESLAALLAENDCRFLGYSPLGRGFLSGAFKSPDDFPPGDQRRDLPRFQGENFYRNLRLVEELKTMAEEIGATAAQLAVAWCRRLGNATPVVGGTEPSHIDEAFAGAHLVVPAGFWERLDIAFPADAIAGARYPQSAMQRLEASR